jgi:hypothetical protein
MADPLDIQIEEAKTAVISGATDPVTIVAGVAGKRQVVTYLYLEAASATNITFKSGSTALTGAFAAPILTDNNPLILSNSGFPVLTGTALGDALTVTNSGTVALEGWAIILETDNG